MAILKMVRQNFLFRSLVHYIIVDPKDVEHFFL